MKVAVTGATGHLGANLVRLLLDQGSDVRAITAEPLGILPRSIEWLDMERKHADITDPRAVLDAVNGADVVFHLAARISLLERDDDDVWSTNVLGTKNVIDACVATGVRRLIHVSSVAAAAPVPRRAVNEDSALSIDPALPAYARSKAAGERLIDNAVTRGLDAVVIRPTGILGPYDFGPSMMGRTLIDMWRGRIPVSVGGGFNLVDVRDMAAALVEAERRGARGARYVVGGHWLSMMELAEISAGMFGTPVPRFVMPPWAARVAAGLATTMSRVTTMSSRFTTRSLDLLNQQRLVLDGRAMEELGHRARPIEQTLEDTYEWFGSIGLIDARPRLAVS